MNTQTTKILSIVGLIILGVILFLGGMFFGRVQTSAGFYPGGMMLTEDRFVQSGAFGSGMMGNAGFTSTTGEISVTGEQAIDIAQEYLDASLPGTTADDHATPFPGYYTLHILNDGETVGMLSVNAYTGEVFPHFWHGDFVETAG